MLAVLFLAQIFTVSWDSVPAHYYRVDVYQGPTLLMMDYVDETTDPRVYWYIYDHGHPREGITYRIDISVCRATPPYGECCGQAATMYWVGQEMACWDACRPGMTSQEVECYPGVGLKFPIVTRCGE